MTTTRRSFIQTCAGTTAAISLGAVAPQFFQNMACAAEAAKGENILVVLQLTGGNDGLNTIVPFKNEAYKKARPKLGIAADKVLKINDELGFHPSLKGLAKLLESGKLAIVQGVGYPEPNRSHFESMDIWHTCARKGGPRQSGWLGRYLDGLKDADTPGIHLGEDQQPLAIVAEKTRCPSISSPEKFRLQDGGAPEVKEAITQNAQASREGKNDLLAFLQTSTTSALTSSERISKALEAPSRGANYPDHALGKKFKTAAQLIAAEMPTRVYYFDLDGFDTHAQQPDAHAGLLHQFSASVESFLDDLTKMGQSKRVTVMAFSEFGRRVAENASDGTDHGAAGPMFLLGDSVKPGLVGELPSLTDLDDGDLKFQIDFRQVYAAILKDWLKAASFEVLGGRFEPISIFSS
jgi:uncharacterized protein (DUF1501 family)